VTTATDPPAVLELAERAEALLTRVGATTPPDRLDLELASLRTLVEELRDEYGERPRPMLTLIEGGHSDAR
jgi:hypothetical protein